MGYCHHLRDEHNGYYWCTAANKYVDPNSNYCMSYAEQCGYYQDFDKKIGGSGSSGCFLTTACVDTMGLPDDCGVLEAMRSLRDDYILTEVENGGEIVEHYYEVAPQIVKTINEKKDHQQIWKDLYETEIVPCADMVCKNDDKAAYEKYSAMLEKLEKEYLI